MQTKSLYEVVDEHIESVEDPIRKLIRFTASGNIYIRRHLPAIDNHNKLYIPIIDGIERTDLQICAAPSLADAMLLKREGIIS